MKSLHLIIPFIATVFLAGCGNPGSTVSEGPKTRHMEMPSVPAMITDGNEAMSYLVENWWKSFTDPSKKGFRCDSLYVGGVEKGELEQSFSSFTYALDLLSPDKARSLMSGLYDRILLCEEADSSSNIFEGMVDIVCRYLYDPNSPMRNEDYYQPFAAALSTNTSIPEVKREEYRRDATLCKLNALGTKAADFRFSDRYGKVRSLYSVKADWILLFFSNPGCEACKSIIDRLNASAAVENMISSGTLAVLNIYIDEDLAEWYKYMPIYPKSWYNGFDPNNIIRSDGLYHVRAIPSLYILDGEKRVKMKDAPEDKAIDFLEKLTETLNE